MSLRYRLFLWVSGLFLVAALFSLGMESYVTHRELKRAQGVLQEKILASNEARRRDLESFLASSIAEGLVAIDAILNNISSFTPQILRFGPTIANLDHGTLKTASDLLMDFKWIDFLQNTNEGKSSSIIIPDGGSVDTTFRVPIEEGLAWVYHQGSQIPYLAIEVPFDFLAPSPLSDHETIVRRGDEMVPTVYLLFDAQKIAEGVTLHGSTPLLQQRLESTMPMAWSEGYALKLDRFLEFFQKASDWLRHRPMIYPQVDRQVVESALGQSPDAVLDIMPDTTLHASASTEQFMQRRQEAVASRFFQINMIWIYASLFHTGMFGDKLLTFPAPEGIGLFSLDHPTGVGLRACDVFSKEALFDDARYFKQSGPIESGSALASAIALIPDVLRGHLYLGNTAGFEIKSGERVNRGYLTLGIDLDVILQKLVLAMHQTAFVVHEGQPMSGFGMTGEKLAIDRSLPFSQMVKNGYGFIPWQGEEYFYLRMQPFSSIDLFFFLLSPKAQAFAFLQDLQHGTEEVVGKIVFNIHAIGIIALCIAIGLLHNISRRITKPIIELARATEKVGEGRLEEVQVNSPPLKHQDEIAILCHSFEEMVRGLREKEKVKGVLNKVVSQEIAQEILKGNIHLGGEVKQVTVLFADIRGFTHMTQHMSPEEVVELLNTCMTKISHPIDAYGGVIDKYVGDEAMALFGAPIAHPESTLRAIFAAIDILSVLQEWNQERLKLKLPLVEMGIGLHTGMMLAGNMGAENRLNYTVLGSNVNLAARLCGVAKGGEILISQETLNAPLVKQSIDYEALPSMELKGFDHPISVFCVRRRKTM